MKHNSLENMVYSNLPKPLQHFSVVQTVELALAEDLSADGDLEINRAQLASKDVTSSATLGAGVILHGKITAKASGIIAGLDLAAVIFKLVDPKIEFSAKIQDGQQVEVGVILAELTGPGIGMLAAERTALNFVGRISGIATLTRKYVDAVAGTNATILDTRKTAPGLRVIALQNPWTVCSFGEQ